MKLIIPALLAAAILCPRPALAQTPPYRLYLNVVDGAGKPIAA